MTTLLQDFRYGFRGLLRAPGFALTALFILAVGIGATATVFSFVDALLFRPPPAVAHPSGLVAVYTSDFSSGPYGESSYPDYLTLASEASAFDQLAGYSDDGVAVLRVGEVAERVGTASVSGGFFELLGLRPAQGRLLMPADLEPGAAPAVVIAHDLWRRAFGSDPAVIGRPLVLDGRACEIVGVLPPRFEGLELGRRLDVWIPLVPSATAAQDRGSRGLSIVGRLRAGVALDQAQAQVDGIAARLAITYPETNRGTLARPDDPRPMLVRPFSRLHPSFRTEVARIGAVTMGAVGFVLLIACANVAGLLLARATTRAREMAVRMALGAGRLRLLRQLLTESLLLGLAGGALGLLLALWMSGALPSFFPAEQARMLDAGVDVRVFVVTAVIAVVSSVVFGLAPGLHALQYDPARGLQAGGARASDSRGIRLRRGMVAAQVALAFVLLVSAGLLVRSLTNALGVDLGFATRSAVVVSVEIPSSEMDRRQGVAYYREVADRVLGLPGVDATAFVRTLPLSGGARRGFRIEGYEPQPGEDLELHFNIVSERYFDTMRMPVQAGRAFDGRDASGGLPVVVVNDVLAWRYFGGLALGRHLRSSGGTDLEIVGVVQGGPQISVQSRPQPVVYYPLAQSHVSRMTLVARTIGDPLLLAESIRREVQEVHRGVAVFRTTTLESHLGEALAGDRLTATLVGSAGVMALLLAMVGLYGVVAFAVVARQREIGVRMALGARPAHVIRLVIGEGLWMSGAGLVAGVAAALATTRVLESMLFGIRASDAQTFLAVGAILSAIGLLATWVPARRALRLEPSLVLRQE